MSFIKKGEVTKETRDEEHKSITQEQEAERQEINSTANKRERIHWQRKF